MSLVSRDQGVRKSMLLSSCKTVDIVRNVNELNMYRYRWEVDDTFILNKKPSSRPSSKSFLISPTKLL